VDATRDGDIDQRQRGRAGAARVEESPRRSLYLDIAGYLAAQKKDSVPFTPAVPAVYGLEAALDELLEILMRDKSWHDQLARKVYVAILELMTKPAPKPAQ